MRSDKYDESDSFLGYLEYEQRNIWRSINKADDEGLLTIDEKNDVITITNNLSQTYPELHQVINMLNMMWSSKRSSMQSVQ
ncbi:hypothetical protein [Desulfosediminicola flagellatus]|uniref:hypothetical protein n=1 Tax=Desulfosediminicola flagellatus TaxID=2569541 RepID=UPI0010ACA8B8|nr:hypothetical protein [Desulfosediminicola flagellatus]